MKHQSLGLSSSDWGPNDSYVMLNNIPEQKAYIKDLCMVFHYQCKESRMVTEVAENMLNAIKEVAAVS